MYPEGKFNADGSEKDPVFVPAPIYLKDPTKRAQQVTDIYEPYRAGTVKRLEGAHEKLVPGAMAPGGTTYPYSIANIRLDWLTPGTYTYYTGGILKTKAHVFREPDNRAWWDHFYEGYTAPITCDYSQNCHGFAFGVGNWPRTAVPFLRSYVECWKRDAIIASNKGHSISVGGTESVDSYGLYFQAVIRSDEQFRESGTYSRSATLPKQLNLKDAHRFPANHRGKFGDFEGFKHYRKPGPVAPPSIAGSVDNLNDSATP